MQKTLTEPRWNPVAADAARAESSRRQKTKKRDVRRADRAFYWILRLLAFGLVAILASMVGFLAEMAWPALERFGPGFFLSRDWDPVAESYGALPFIWGTVVSSLLALLISFPVSIGVALFLTELAPRGVARIIGFLVEMLAAIPSVVYGLWGIFVLAPWLRTTVEPFLAKHFGFLPLFQGPPYGVGMLAAGLILAIMITPTISAISREVFRAVPQLNREAALALGATRWETISVAVLRTSRSGMLGAVILGLGRALGETMAVTMVIGNRADISLSLFDPAQTMASLIANEYAEASDELHLASLVAVGLALFAVTLVTNGIARGLAWGFGGRHAGGAR